MKRTDIVVGALFIAAAVLKIGSVYEQVWAAEPTLTTNSSNNTTISVSNTVDTITVVGDASDEVETILSFHFDVWENASCTSKLRTIGALRKLANDLEEGLIYEKE